ncbi:MAG: L-threonine 3-dehydrogenase [Planctomycetota bacterium]|nr:MAG: L-threonine 3-dehydrogenase [Planctomycetota bacterium]
MTRAADQPATTAAPVAAGGPTMRALVKARADVGLDFDPARPVPSRGQPGPREVLIRVLKAGVCGTDRHIWEWDDWARSRIPVGIVTGHEFVGVVERVGDDVTTVRPGQRVSAEGHIAPADDYNTRTGNAHIARGMQIIGVDRDGCFADYIMMPEGNIWPVDERIDDVIAAVMDPLGNAVHTVMAAGVSAKNVLITGVGAIGLMAVAVARAAGAARIFTADINPAHGQLALDLGADEFYDVRGGDEWVRDLRAATRGDGADALLEMSGAPDAINAGLDALRNGGTAALLGLPSRPFPFDFNSRVIFKGATVLGVNGRRMFETWYQMEALLLSGRLDLGGIITHRIPMANYARAFELMQAGEAIKIVLDIND